MADRLRRCLRRPADRPEPGECRTRGTKRPGSVPRAAGLRDRRPRDGCDGEYRRGGELQSMPLTGPPPRLAAADWPGRRQGGQARSLRSEPRDGVLPHRSGHRRDRDRDHVLEGRTGVAPGPGRQAYVFVLSGSEPLVSLPCGDSEHRGKLLRPDSVPIDEGEHFPVPGGQAAEDGQGGRASCAGTADGNARRRAVASRRDRQGLLSRDGKQPGPEQVRCAGQVLRAGYRRSGGSSRCSIAAGQRAAVVEDLSGVRREQPGEGRAVDAIGPPAAVARGRRSLKPLRHRASSQPPQPRPAFAGG